MKLGGRLRMPIALISVALFSSIPAVAQFSQQGPKLVGAGATGLANQGAVAISADGNTAIVGGARDNSNAGAVWVFTRSGSTWAQQGHKLVGTGAVGNADQGRAVAISADGNTAIVGGWTDNSNHGAVWVFTRSGGTWTQLGNKLVAADAVGAGRQGWSVAISADGNTLIFGGTADNSNAGAAWVFTRNGQAWSQQGGKLVGAGAAGAANQGDSVAISSDGNTAVVSGPGDNSNVGAVWVFTRSGGTWSQQGGKLVGAGEVGDGGLGSSVAISGDGNTAIAGGLDDNLHAGAAWVFTRSDGAWSQEGSKLVGTGALGAAGQGNFVGISADGNTAVVGGDHDNSDAGAVWVFTRSGGVWSQQGGKLVGTGAAGAADQGSTVAISGDGATVVIGGPNDARSSSNAAGAVWIFAASGGCVSPGRGCVLRIPGASIRATGARP